MIELQLSKVAEQRKQIFATNQTLASETFTRTKCDLDDF